MDALYHSFGYHFTHQNSGYKPVTVTCNVIKGAGYIPFVGVAILLPALALSIFELIKARGDDGKENLRDFHKGMIVRELIQVIPGSCLVLIILDIKFSIDRYKRRINT